MAKAIARREALRAQLDAARRRLEAQAKTRAAAERADDDAKLAARAQRHGQAKGKHPSRRTTRRALRSRATCPTRTAG